MNGQEIIILIQGKQLRKAIAPLRMNRRERLRIIRHLMFPSRLGRLFLDVAITAVEAVCFLVAPLFLFLPWILYDVIAKWLGLPAVISINCL